MLARIEAIIPSTHTADFTGLDGYFVETAAGVDTIVNAATDIPLGCILEGLPRQSTIATQNFHGVVKVKVAATTPGTIVRGTYLTLRADGTVQADAGTGARVRVARALESGAANELIDAYLVEPVTLA